MCDHDYERPDMAYCSFYERPICSLCCSLDAHCHDACKSSRPSSRPRARAISASLFASKIAPHMVQRLLKVGGVMLALAVITAAPCS